MPRTRRLAALAAAAASLTAAAPASADTGYAVDQRNRLLTFDTTDPAGAVAQPVRGLPANSTIVGIDERPKTGALYAVLKARSGAASAYTIDPATGRATLAFALVDATTKAPVVLTGATQGVDFNPSADALRIISSSGQNLRALPSDRVVATVQRSAGDTFVDGYLSYGPFTDPMRAPALGVDAAAYTNNVATTGGATELLDIDSANEDLVLQSPPNNGTLVRRGDVGIAGRPVQGFDITTASSVNTGYVVLGDTRPTGRPTDALEAILAALQLQRPPRSELSRIDLATGALTPVGTFPTNLVVDVAIDTPAPVAP